LFWELEMAPASSFPIIDMGLLAGEERPAAMDMLRDACENWGFFQVGRHQQINKTNAQV
jgi:aminocyclopropanecarboxylate oxidase